MTIRPGESWGETVPLGDVVVAQADRRLVEIAAERPGADVAVQGGDLWRTLGARRLPDDRVPEAQVLRVPVDVVDVELPDGSAHRAAAHVVLRRPWTSGGWFRGEVVAVMNAEWWNELDVVPRGHPNDGRVEVIRLDPSVGPRQRLAIRRRMRSASHLPHPGLTTRSVRAATIEVDRPAVVLVDGSAVGTATSVSVTVVPDAIHVVT